MKQTCEKQTVVYFQESTGQLPAEECLTGSGEHIVLFSNKM